MYFLSEWECKDEECNVRNIDNAMKYMQNKVKLGQKVEWDWIEENPVHERVVE